MTQNTRLPPDTQLDRLTRLAAHSFGARRAWLVLEDGAHQFASHRADRAQHKELMRHAPIHDASGRLLGSLWVIVPASGWGTAQQELLESFAAMVAHPLESFILQQQVGVQAQAGDTLRQHYPAVLAFDAAGRILYGNPASVRLFQKPLEQLAECLLSDFVLDLQNVGLMQALERYNTPFALRGVVGGLVVRLEGILTQLSLSGKSCPCLCLRPLEEGEPFEEQAILEQRLREYVWRTDFVVVEWDSLGRVLGWNPAAEQLFGYSEAEAVGHSLLDLVALEGNREVLRNRAAQSLEGQVHVDSVSANRTKSGRKIYCSWSSTPLFSGQARPLSVVSFVRDVTHQIEVEEELRRSRARDQALREALPDLVFTLSRGGRILDYHEPSGTLFYLAAEFSLVGRRLADVAPPDLARRYRAALLEAFGSGLASFEHTLPVGGALRHFEARLQRYDTDEAVCVVRDVTERRHAQQQLAHMAYHDRLTNLPNRELFGTRLEEALKEARIQGFPVSVAFVDLNRFKQVNDTLGHAFGDLLLEQVASRLRAVLRSGDTLARMGGDEFTLLMPGVGLSSAQQTAQQVVELLTRPFTLEGHTVQIGAAVGLSSYPEDGSSAEDLLRTSDGRMYALKKARPSER